MNSYQNIKRFFLPLIILLGVNTFTFSQQKDDLSSGKYVEINAFNELTGRDKNKDGKYEKIEDTIAWKRYEYLDANKDGGIDFTEFKNFKLNYLETNGKRLLNVLYKNTKEGDLYLDIYYPTHKSDLTNLPVIIYAHGGGWSVGSKMGAGNAFFAKVFDRLTKKGFCIVSVDYRLYRKGGAVTMRDCVIDVKDATRYLSKNSKALGLNSNQFFAFGDSAGSQIAQILLLGDTKSFKGAEDLADSDFKMVAGVSWYGPSDFENLNLFNYDNRPNFNDRFGDKILGLDTNPNHKSALYKEMSPINYLTKYSPPLLLIQGDGDTANPVKHAYNMQEKAKNVNAPVEIMIIEHAGHNWREATPGIPISPTLDDIIEKTTNFFLSFILKTP